jgi:hypothetical protein
MCYAECLNLACIPSFAFINVMVLCNLMLSFSMQCCYAEYHFVPILFCVIRPSVCMLNVILVSTLMLNVIMLCHYVEYHSGECYNGIVLSVIHKVRCYFPAFSYAHCHNLPTMLNVIMLGVTIMPIMLSLVCSVIKLNLNMQNFVRVIDTMPSVVAPKK